MVARAAWLTVEPEINLRDYLASEETRFLPPTLEWMPAEWVPRENEFEIHFNPVEGQ